MCEQKTSDHIKINIRMQNPSQEPPVSSKAPNHELKDMDVLSTLKIYRESQNLDQIFLSKTSMINEQPLKYSCGALDDTESS